MLSGTAVSVPASALFREESDENRPAFVFGDPGRTSGSARRAGTDPCHRQVRACTGSAGAGHAGAGRSRRDPHVARAPRGGADGRTRRAVARQGAGGGLDAAGAATERSRRTGPSGEQRSCGWRVDRCHLHHHHHHRPADHHPDRPHRRLTAAIRASALAAAVTFVAAAAPASGQSPPVTRPAGILDVPYVPQSEELCGGAAAAMVMRYWGATGVYAETFASLVDRREKGIRGRDLIDTLERRGWSAASFQGDEALVERSLEARRPLIALIEDRPGRFHYVVIVSWAAGKVIVHDPARRPFQVHDTAAFLRAWSRSDHWTLLALPPPASARKKEALEDEPGTPTSGACGTQ